MSGRVLLASAWALAAMLSPRGAAAQASDAERGPPTAAAAARSWSLALSAELGMGTRALDVPMDGVVYETRTGLFPAAGIGFALEHGADEKLSVGLSARYQSSVGHDIVEQHTDGSEHAMGVRSHRLELSITPRLRLDAAGTWALAGAAGYAFRNLRPGAHHLVTPAYTLAGPHLRVELRLALWDDALRLRVGPEVQWIAHVGQDLRDRGSASGGLGAGGEAALEVPLGQHFAVGASYREMHSWIDSSQSERFVDVARFTTAHLRGTL